MKATRSTVLSMRLSVESGKRLKRMANRHGWTPSDASARLVEEGLRRSEFAFIDFRDSAASLHSRQYARSLGDHVARPELQREYTGCSQAPQVARSQSSGGR